MNIKLKLDVEQVYQLILAVSAAVRHSHNLAEASELSGNTDRAERMRWLGRKREELIDLLVEARNAELLKEQALRLRRAESRHRVYPDIDPPRFDD